MVCNFQIIVERHLIQPFKPPLAYHRVSHTFLGKRTFLVWFLAVLIKILILEWLEMFATKLKLLNQLAFIPNFSLLSKASKLKCQLPFQPVEYLWLINLNKLKIKLKRMLLVVARPQKKNNKSMEQTWQLISLTIIWFSFWKMINCCSKLQKSIVLEKC